MTGPRKHPTLNEVARKAGVGTTTVSRVINGGLRVDPATLARVRGVILKLGYVPSQAARVLKGGRTSTIGLLIPSIADPFFSSCAEAAQAVARNHDSLLIVATTQNDPQREINYLTVLMRHRVDGLIITPSDSRNRELCALLRRLPVPIVALDRPLAGAAIPSVLTDNFAGARSATAHLIQHGYRRIVCLTGEPALYTIRERMRGYREAMKSASLIPMTDTSITDYVSAEFTLKRLLTAIPRLDALFTLKNSTTTYAFEVLQALNIRIPEAVALLGYDDFELAGTVQPSITVVGQPVQEIGRAAAELLFRQMEPAAAGRVVSIRQRSIQLRTRLIRRRSCGCSPLS
jgi:LacI family transcriptional regulator